MIEENKKLLDVRGERDQLKLIDGSKLSSLAIFRLSALGDVVMMVPTVRAIQKAFPGLAITWIISRPMYALLQGLDGVDFIVIDKPKSLGDYWRLRRQLKRHHFDVLFAAQANLRANLVYPLIKAKCRLGFDNKRSREGHRWFVDYQIECRRNHILDSFLQFARAIGVKEAELRWDLPIDGADKQYAEQKLSEKRWVAINPCASKLDRNWPIERFIELMQRMKRQWGCCFVLTGGNSDAEKTAAKKIIDVFGDDCLDLVAKTTLRQLAAVLAKVELLVSPDTGPAHLAVAMQTPVVGLYADITSKLSGPYLYQELVVDRYQEALMQFRRKKMQNVPWITRIHDVKAMELIQVDDVMKQVKKVMDND